MCKLECPGTQDGAVHACDRRVQEGLVGQGGKGGAGQVCANRSAWQRIGRTEKSTAAAPYPSARLR